MQKYFRIPLKPGNQRRKHYMVYGFDIETYNNNKNFLLCSIYGDTFRKTFYTKEDFISEISKKKYGGCMFAATNLSFDFFGTFYNQKQQLAFKTLFRGSNLITAETYIENGVLTRNPEKTKKFKLTFIDTMNFASLSVEKMGKIINLPKLHTPDFIGKKPVNKAEWQEMVEYNMRDSEISKKFIDFLFDSFKELGANPRKTIASTAMSLFRNVFLTETYFRHDVSVLLDQFQAYYGGRVECFKRGKIENMHYYDFNSLYPSVMKDNVYPDPNTMRMTYRNSKDKIMQYEGFSLVKIWQNETRYPILPFRTADGKVLFPCGNIEGWYTHVELREAMKNGAVLTKVMKTYYYLETCSPFKSFVDTMYTKRQEYKEQGSPMEYVVKILMNSLYGKFGQKFINKDNWLPFDFGMKELEKFDFIERYGNYVRVVKKMSQPAYFCFPCWAAYVTAHARLKLWRAIKECDPVYVDTDSLITDKPMPYSNALGDLKLEMTINEGIIVRPKFYGLHAFKGSNEIEHVKIKGLAKRMTYLELKGFLVDPHCKYNKFMKFKESLRRGFIPNEIREVEKRLCLEDSKRVWAEKFDMLKLQDSKPITLTNIEERKKVKSEIYLPFC